MSLISELMGKHLRHEPELKNSRRNVYETGNVYWTRRLKFIDLFID